MLDRKPEGETAKCVIDANAASRATRLQSEPMMACIAICYKAPQAAILKPNQ